MIKLRMLIEKETLTFQPVTVPINKHAENLENARYIYKETYSITVVPRRRSSFFQTFFFRVFGKVVDLTRSIMKTRIVVKNLWNSMLNVNLYAY